MIPRFAKQMTRLSPRLRRIRRLVWSFDLATPGTPNITAIQVDAQTGDIVSTEIETPAQEKKESEAGQE